MTYQQAKQIATELTGRTPRWCDVRDENDSFPPAPTNDAMDDCIAIEPFLKEEALILYWQDQRPISENAGAICYF